MSLFGEKCVRCGKQRTKRSYEGLPTCGQCEAELQAKARAEGEETRTCTLDGTRMSKEVVLNIVIDRCPKCKGVWLDGGELELIRSAVAEGMAMDLARAMTFAG